MANIIYNERPNNGLDWDAEEALPIFTVDFDSMVEEINEEYYGGLADDRAAGHEYFFNHGTVDGAFTEETPAVRWARTHPEFVNQYERLLEEGREFTFPEYTQEILRIQRDAEEELRSQRIGKFITDLGNTQEGEAPTRRGNATTEILNRYFGGNSQLAGALVTAVTNAALHNKHTAEIGPSGGKNATLGLHSSTPSQVLAHTIGAINYNKNGSTTLKKLPLSTKLPKANRKGYAKVGGNLVSVSVIARGTTKAKWNQPEGKKGILETKTTARLIEEAFREGIVRYIAALSAVSKENKNLEPGDSPAVSRGVSHVGEFVASEVERIILDAGLTEGAQKLLRKSQSSRSASARADAEEYFWREIVGVEGVGTGTFRGLLPNFPAVCGGLIRQALAQPEAFLAGFPADVGPRITQVRLRDDSVGGKYKTFYDLLILPEGFWEGVEEVGMETINNLATWSVKQYFPSLPMAGECGGKVGVVAPLRRANFLIKHSAQGLPQAEARSAGARALACITIMQATVDYPNEEEEEDILGIFDLEV